jgi:hypothetical protein
MEEELNLTKSGVINELSQNEDIKEFNLISRTRVSNEK